MLPRPCGAATLSAAEVLKVGATPVCTPLIRICPPSDAGEALRTAAAKIRSYDWVIVTSVAGADRLLEVVGDPSRLRAVAAIGPATERRFTDAGKAVDLLPKRYVAEGLLEEFVGVPSARALLARSAEAREALPVGLRALGWEVDVVAAYRTERVRLSKAERSAVLACDAVLLTSSSVVSSYCEQLPPPRGLVASIGPITSAAARERGLQVDVEASDYTISGLLAALEAHAASLRTPFRASLRAR